MGFVMLIFRDLPKSASYHYHEGNINWITLIYTMLAHVLAVGGIFALPQCSKETLLLSFLLWSISIIGITVGAHRLWSHRSFEASFVVRLVLMLCSSIANQGSIFHWVRDHRVHHRFCETDADPHNASRGFFFSHIGWLLLKKDPVVIKAGRDMDFSDIMDDPVVRWQHQLHPWFNTYMCYILPAQIASYFWNESFYTAILVAGGLRYCVVLHCTFLVNSAGHVFGDRPYDTKQSYATENPIVSFLTVGEGWHNWHHMYPYDYAASEFGISSQFNLSKLLIDTLAMIGLVWGRKRATGAWTMRRARRYRHEQITEKKKDGPTRKTIGEMRIPVS